MSHSLCCGHKRLVSLQEEAFFLRIFANTAGVSAGENTMAISLML
jgi:hypothetical protein